MKSLLPLFALLLLLIPTTQAQKILEQKAVLAAGQRLSLQLKQATSIRLHVGSGPEAVVRTIASVNGGQLNDALLLQTARTEAGVTITSSLDEQLLRASSYAGNCPDGATTWGGHWQNGKQTGAVCIRMEVDVTVPPSVAVQVNTISGNIEATGLTGPLDLKSISGFVDVSWPPRRGAEVAFQSISGEVYTDQDIAFINRKDHPLVGYQLRGTLGGSGPAVRLESVSGDVFFRKQK